MNSAVTFLERTYRDAARSRQTEFATKAAPDTGDWESIQVDRVIDTRERTFAAAPAVLTEAVGVGLALAIAILLLGLPVALIARGIIDAGSWLFG